MCSITVTKLLIYFNIFYTCRSPGVEAVPCRLRQVVSRGEVSWCLEAWCLCLRCWWFARSHCPTRALCQ